MPHRSRHRLHPNWLGLAALLPLLGLAPATSAQSLNLDFNRATGPGAGAPASSYTAASGQGGVWNGVTATSDPDGTMFAVSSASATQSVFLKVTASNGMDSATFGSGEFGKLMADYAFGLTENGKVEVAMSGAEPGIYEIFVYTGLPESEAFYTQFGQTLPHKAYVGCTNTDGVLLDSAVTQGYVAPPTFEAGVNYARLFIGIPETTTLTIGVHADLAYSLAKVGVNGIQLRKWEHNRLHVTPAGAGDRSGRDWANAMGSLHDAFAFADAAAGAVDEIWVKSGTYKPALNDRSASFHLPGYGTLVRGGFAGTESTAEERDGSAVTILSGNIGNVLTPVDNSYAVVRAESSWTALERVTIRDGRADGVDANDRLAGGLVTIDGTLHLTNCIVEKNTGLTAGGLYSGSTWTEITGCTFRENSGASGGAIHHHEVDDWWWDYWLMVDNSSFIDNDATTVGGAIYWTSDEDQTDWNSIRFWTTNCRFLGNHAGMAGGAVAADGERIILLTSLLSGNGAWDGGAISFVGESIGVVGCTVTGNSATSKTGGVVVNIPAIVDAECYLGGSILWGNTGAIGTPLAQRQVRNTALADPAAYIGLFHSCMQGDLSSYLAEGATNLDPLFVDPDGVDDIAGTLDDDLHLRVGSPCIDAGVDYDSDPAFDLDGQERKVDLPEVANTGVTTLPHGGIDFVDMGCHESQPAASCLGDLTLDGVVDAADLAVLLGAWGSGPEGDLDGDGQVGGSDLATLLGAWGPCS